MAINRAHSLIGEFLDDGKLLVVDVLGTGASGVVYRALQVGAPPGQKPAEYAVKWVLKPKAGSKDRDERMLRVSDEVYFHMRLGSHANIVPFRRVFEDDRSFFIVMDSIAGGDLHDMIKHRRVYHNNDALTKSVFLQMCDAVQHCHDSQIAHCDLKPDNFLCSRDGSRVYLSDFGLSASTDLSTVFGRGTPSYISPECLHTDVRIPSYCTIKNDIWSLGIILTNLITGRSPWTMATVDDESFAAFLHHPNFFQRVLPIPAKIETILRRIFTLNPMDRISLPELRAQILALDKFCLQGKELERAPRRIALFADFYSRRVPSSLMAATKIPDWDVVGEDSDSDTDSSGTTLYSSTDSEDIYFFDSPDSSWSAPQAREDRSPDSILDVIRASAFAAPPGAFALVSEDGDSSRSEESSAGPATPETHPVDPSIAIPDLLNAGLGDSPLSDTSSSLEDK